MRFFIPILALVVLAACEPTRQTRPEPAVEPRKSGISVSGYGRIGVSTRL